MGHFDLIENWVDMCARACAGIGAYLKCDCLGKKGAKMLHISDGHVKCDVYVSKMMWIDLFSLSLFFRLRLFSSIKGHIHNLTHFHAVVAVAADIRLRGRRSLRRSNVWNVCVFWRLNHRPNIFFRNHQNAFEEARTKTNALFCAHTHTHAAITHSITLRRSHQKKIFKADILHSWRSWYFRAFYTCKKPFEMVHSNILLLHFKCLFSLFDTYTLHIYILYDTLCQFEYYSLFHRYLYVRFAHKRTYAPSFHGFTCVGWLFISVDLPFIKMENPTEIIKKTPQQQQQQQQQYQNSAIILHGRAKIPRHKTRFLTVFGWIQMFFFLN